jgi:ubiquinone/menaquinone biosynthesis C-methylase UbiE
MVNKFKNVLKMIKIYLSPSFAEKVANEYWQNTTITHGRMDEDIFDFFYNELKKIIVPSREDLILDYGGGNGEIAYRFKKDGFKIEHYDISLKMRENARKKYNLISLDDNELKRKNNFYSKILFHNAFFYIHPKKQKEVLKFLYTLLNENGKLFITDTPDFDKRKFVNDNFLYLLITKFFPVYQIDLAGFYIKHTNLKKMALEVRFKKVTKIDSWANYRSHWILEK